MAKKKIPSKRKTLNQAKGTSKQLESRILSDQKLMKKAIDELEDRVLKLYADLRTSDLGLLMGPKVNLKLAQQVHKDMVKTYRELYGKSAREVVAGYKEINKIVKSNYAGLGEVARFTGVDRTMLSELRKAALRGFEYIGIQSQTRISNAMYQAIAAQSPWDDLVRAIEGALVGREDARGRPLSSYAELYANDGIMNYYNAVNQEKARSLNMRWMLYVGTIMGTTRDFCKRRVGKVYTINQINSWTHDWSGKSGPALTHRGGWNCRHHWQPVRKEWVDNWNRKYKK